MKIELLESDGTPPNYEDATWFRIRQTITRKEYHELRAKGMLMDVPIPDNVALVKPKQRFKWIMPEINPPYYLDVQ